MNFICVPVCVCMCCEMNKWRCAALCVPSHTSHTPHSCVLLPDTRGAAELHKPREHSECEHTHTHTQLMQIQLGLYFLDILLFFGVSSALHSLLSLVVSLLCAQLIETWPPRLFQCRLPSFGLHLLPSFSSPFPPPSPEWLSGSLLTAAPKQTCSWCCFYNFCQ